MNFLHICSQRDLVSASFIKSCVPEEHVIIVKSSPTNYFHDIDNAIKVIHAKYGVHVHGLIVSNVDILKKFLYKLYKVKVHGKDEATLHKYQGAMFEHEVTLSNGVKYNLPVVITPPADSMLYSKQTRFLFKHYVSKLYDRKWLTTPTLNWELGTVENLGKLFKEFSDPSCILCSVDIETVNAHIDASIAQLSEIDGVPIKGMTYLGYGKTKSGAKAKHLEYQMPVITCVGYTGIFYNSVTNTYTSKTVVIPFQSLELYHWIGKFNKIPAPKVLQNGLYDCAYFLRFNLPISNWAFDTYGMMHAWLVELPRSLDFISGFSLRNYMYWKDESSMNLYEYNAQDCHNTAWSCLALLSMMPDWAKRNFEMNFKKVFPALTCNIEGWAEDSEEAKILWAHYQKEVYELENWWNIAITQNFNVASAKQVLLLFKNILGADIKKTDKKSLEGIMHRNPVWRMLVQKLFQTREARKADSTYAKIITFCGRVMYKLDPFGTDTSRHACKSGDFWCGTQIQNIPMYAKKKFVFDPGWNGVAIDNAQSESRTTAYITGDEKLIDAVENAPDFHTRNASMFFGIPEEELFRMKKENYPLFDKYRNRIGKRINHGANYNMMENMLIATMTPMGIIEAKHTLGLPGTWSFRQVARYLLDCFDKTYPTIRSKEPGGYHYFIIEQVRQTSMLVAPDGWTRYTFKEPWERKSDLNELVAHLPQCWSARIIDRAFYKIWKRLQIDENLIRVKAQIHDEIIYQVRPENEAYTVEIASDYMAEPSTIGDRVMIIPNDPKVGGKYWSDLKG